MASWLTWIVLSVCLAPEIIRASSCPSLTNPPSKADVNDFVGSPFDIVVIGGGTAGIALAARLAQNSHLNIGLIEAGAFHVDDPLVDIPGFWGEAIQNPDYDWNFLSISQRSAAGRNISVPRGKMLGGSSGLNALAWNRASSPEYDVWSNFSSPAWTWNALLPFFKRAESVNLHPADPYPGISPAQRQQASDDLPRVAGFDGPIKASRNVFYPDPALTIAETLNGMGIRTNAEADDGDATGLYNVYVSVDRQSGSRSYSPKGYLCGRRMTGNFKILTGAQATRVLFNKSPGLLRATGVEITVNGTLYAVQTKHEVVLAAGSVQSPQLLELSGIGDTRLLRKAGVDVLMDLPGVGENLQEHLFVGAQWELKPGHFTWDVLRSNTTLAEEQRSLYNRTGTGLWTDVDSLMAFLPPHDFLAPDRLRDLLSLFDAESLGADESTIQSLQYPVQRALLAQGAVSISQIIQWSSGRVNVAPNTSYVYILGCVSHPMSRGSVHINTSSALDAPTIDLGFLTKSFDAELLLDVIRYILSIGRHEPFASIIAERNVPLPSVQSDADLLTYVRETSVGGDHLIGTAVMAPRERGGVVDDTLKVYGTSNLRVIDASIIPSHISANTQATVYAIAEKMAAEILELYS
ncbi:unnamed protein product [Peniophora sp. CBMAI 1063]|nr:unnamed protein product [Peniophora sp. CBMAI 1063]